MKLRKAIFLFSILCSVVASCNSFAEMGNVVSNSKEQSITALLEETTKTSIDGEWNTIWSASDKMSVFVTRNSQTNQYGQSTFTYKKGNLPGASIQNSQPRSTGLQFIQARATTPPLIQ